jgi:hypothetical protein
MVVLIVVAVVCFVVGIYAASQWLPDLAKGPVGRLSARAESARASES